MWHTSFVPACLLIQWIQFSGFRSQTYIVIVLRKKNYKHKQVLTMLKSIMDNNGQFKNNDTLKKVGCMKSDEQEPT